MKFWKFVVGTVVLAFVFATGLGLGAAAALVGYGYLKPYVPSPATGNAAVPAVKSSPAAAPAPTAPAPASLLDEALQRQRTAAAHTAELEWLKKHTGIDCSVGISEEDCLPFLDSLSAQRDILAKVSELKTRGIKVAVTSATGIDPFDGSKQPAGFVSENGSLIFIYRQASPEQLRAYLLR